MNFTPLKHSFTKVDTEQISKMGYQIQSSGSTTLAAFMKKFFANFNLVSLLSVIELQFTQTAQASLSRKIYFDSTLGMLKIEYKNRFQNEDDALLFIRKFTNKDGVIEIKHEYCIIPKNSRNSGLIKPVFRESLQQYINIGAKRILVHAGLSGGGYTWAKYGFVAINKKEIDIILNAAKSTLNKNDFAVVKKIYDIYYNNNKNGSAFPIDLWASLDYMKPVLMGSDWHGQLDLKDKEQLRNFKNYVSK